MSLTSFTQSITSTPKHLHVYIGIAYWMLTKQLYRCCLTQIPSSLFTTQKQNRKEFLKLVHRNPAITAGWKGGRPVKTLIKILQGWLCKRFGSVYRLTDGCLLARAPAATLILPRKSKMPCSRSQHKSVTSWLPQSEGAEWACMVGCIPKRCLTCTAVENVTVVA